MKIDAENFERLAANGGLIQSDWGNGREKACLMGALAGVSERECTAAGWPLWLVQIGEWINDRSPSDIFVERGRTFYKAVQKAEARGADFDRVFRDVRLKAILPIAMRSIGEGDEAWRVQCRSVVQWSMDNDGEPANNTEAADAADAAKAAEAAAVTGIFEWAVFAAEAAWAAGAAWAAEAAGAAWAAAVTEIFEALIDALNGDA